MGTWRAPPPLDAEPQMAMKHLATLGTTQIGEPVTIDKEVKTSDEDKSQ
jgi:hypothetical protein